jgi:predicted permease
MERLAQDVRYAVRSLLRNPAFTIAAVLTLAIGIGANTAIFSVVDGVLLRPPPFAGMDRVAMVWETDRTSGTTREPASIPDFNDFQQRSQRFERLAAFTPVEVNLTTGTADPQRLATLGVSHGYFATVGLSTIAGRTFTADEDRAGGPRAVIIGEDLWERIFQRDRAAVGRTLRLNDADWQVVGIVARGADFGVLQVLGAASYQRGFAERGDRVQVDAWLPLRPGPAAPRGNHPIFVIGRLAVGAGVGAAQEEMTAITADLERTYPADNVARGAFVERLDNVVFGPVRPAMMLLLAAVAMVLFVACANVANLLLVRAANRSREVTVRTALGAGMRRLAQQYLVEGALLALAGTVLGLVLAWSGVQVLASIAPASIPRAAAVAVDARALAVTAGVSLAIAFVFGLLPTLQARRLDLQGALREDAGRGVAGGRSHRRLRSSLVVAELAMATTLMVGAGLLIRSLWQLQSVDPGFTATGVLKAEFQLPASRYPQNFALFPNWAERKRFYTEVERRLVSQPGVVSVALAAANPLDAGFTSSIRVVGREAEAGSWPEPSIRTISAGYFTTLDVPVQSGHSFEPTDVAGSAPVAIINQAANERYFSGHNALGQRIRLWGADRMVVGIVGNERFKGLAEAAPPAVYLPLDQAPTASAVMVRVSGDPSLAAPLVRRVVREVDPELPLFGVQALTETVRGTMAQRRFTMVVLVAFAAAALALAVVGVHGVLSYAVAQRTREIGIRVALGADMRHVRDLVIADGAKLALAGVTLGLAGALALSRLMSALVFGVRAQDPATFVGVAAVLGAVALLATWLPARRAVRVDPMVALRAD